MRKTKRASVFLGAIACVALLVSALAFAGCSCSSQASSSASASGSAASMSASDQTQVQVPNLVQLEKADAEKLLVNMGLKEGDVKYEFSDTVAKGIVISQDPAALTMVKFGDAVSITVSKGKEQPPDVAMPNLIGKTQTEAEKLLADAKLVAVQSDPIVTNDVEPGKVCMQSVKAGTMIREGSQIKFATAIADNNVEVPNLINDSKDEAIKKLGKLGLGYDTASAYSDKVAEGKVISQSVAAKTQVAKGTVVTITISLGAKPAAKVKVPNIMTFTYDHAVSALESAGLAYRYSGDKNGTVVHMHPAAGTEVEAGTVVSFQLQHEDTLVAVPDVAGMSGKEAGAALDKVGLILDLNGHDSDEKLIGTDPDAGVMVDEGSVIQAAYSDAPDPEPTVAVPDVAGMTGSDAKAVIEAAGLKLSIDQNDLGKKLTGTDPTASTEVDPGSTVKAIVDTSVEVPDVEGMTGQEAKSAMEKVGLKLDYDKADANREVTDTKPQAGSEAQEGDVIKPVYAKEESHSDNSSNVKSQNEQSDKQADSADDKQANDQDVGQDDGQDAGDDADGDEA